ncbi:hypothetical protein [Paenibacillus sedimenti]|uniref:Uncharacterized protein n=1 Tax=Paenibacillus sedimenti TaxID=2770274 RepID=A0A926KP39_9BACL|nr:hypothetical protein [Paenibacillus sedimenti]MBD0381300.1 hypothetical protein [Paenibacillus sedimenti]
MLRYSMYVDVVDRFIVSFEDPDGEWVKYEDLVHEILDTLQHVANMTTCEQTKLYLAERLALHTKT